MENTNLQESTKIKNNQRSILSSKFIIRSILGVIMLNGFIFLAVKDKIYLIGLVIFISLGLCYELIAVIKKQNTPFAINGALVMYFSMVIFWYKVLPSLLLIYVRSNSFLFISYAKTLFFVAYALGLVMLVMLLRRSQLSRQLLLITIVHMVSYISGGTCCLAIRNISASRFFFIFPCLLVITNDIGAYLVGKVVGRTPLTSLSPNKTLKGFIGGFVFTVIVGFLCSYLKIHNKILPDTYDSISSTRINTKTGYLGFPVLYAHGMSFSLAASFFAPFAGFIASAIKRACKKKDFGSIIPGHGGITDRMDCQVLMVYFTYYYLQATSVTERTTATNIYNYLMRNLSQDELESLRKMISAKN